MNIKIFAAKKSKKFARARQENGVFLHRVCFSFKVNAQLES